MVCVLSQVNEAVAEKDNTEKLEWLQKNVKLTDLPERLVFNSLTNFKQQRKLLYMGLFNKVAIFWPILSRLIVSLPPLYSMQQKKKKKKNRTNWMDPANWVDATHTYMIKIVHRKLVI